MAEPKEGKRKTRGIVRIIENIILLAAIVVFCVAGYKYITLQLEYKKANDEYGAMNSEYVKEGEVVMEEIDGEKVMENPIDFAGLIAENSDIAGWITVGAVDISYPIMKGEENEFYLHHTFEKVYNFAGCIFMDYQNKKDFSDRNTVIYGHNMKNGSMFGSLKKFKEEGVYESDPFVWIYTKDYIYKYEIFSCQEISQNATLPLTFKSNKAFLEFTQNSINNSYIDTGVTVGRENKIITLYTCTQNAGNRFIVNAKLAETYKSK